MLLAPQSLPQFIQYRLTGAFCYLRLPRHRLRLDSLARRRRRKPPGRNLPHTLKLKDATSRFQRSGAKQACAGDIGFALSLVLMIAAGLLLRSFWDLLSVRPGFNPHHAMVVRTGYQYPNDPKTDIYGSPAQEAPLLHQIIRRGRTIPGVEEVAIGDMAAIPLGHNRNNLNPFPLIVEGHEVPNDQAPFIHGVIVTPEYLHLLEIPLMRGRSFDEKDNDKAPPVVMINEALARMYFPKADPIGQRLKLPVTGNPSSFAWNTVVGVVAGVRTESLAEASTSQIYFCCYQRRPRDLAIFLRSGLNLAAISVRLREHVQSINPELPVFRRADAGPNAVGVCGSATILNGNGRHSSH